MKEVGVENNRTIQIVHNTWSSSHVSGLATINGRWIKMRVPKEEFNTQLFASILTHELHHNLGLRHNEMCEDKSCEWAKEYKVNKKVPKEPKPKEPITKVRYNHAVQKLKEKEQLLKRTQTLVNKWKKKVRYYEKMRERKD